MSNSAASPMVASSTSVVGKGSAKTTSFIPELQSMIFWEVTNFCFGNLKQQYLLIKKYSSYYSIGLCKVKSSTQMKWDGRLMVYVMRVAAAQPRACSRYALGDSRRPLHETAALVEDIVHTQLINLLHQAAEVAVLRGARVISPEDIIFLMRKDKKKLRRLLKYIQFRDHKSKLLKTLDDDDPLDTGVNKACSWPADVARDKYPSSSVNKRQRLVQDFLGSIDQTGEFLTLLGVDEVDEVKQERMERLEKHTRNMDPAQYSDFCESRQLSFSKKASKFREWLDCSSLDVKPNAFSMEILSYLAYETVAQIVDLALLVKQDMTPKAGDPFGHVISATFFQYHSSNAEAVATKREAESPENTPPSTPSGPVGSGHQGKLHSIAQGNGGLQQDASSKTKQRKRKKSAAACSTEPQSSAIQPAHIREAIRRYSRRIGPLSPFSVVLKQAMHETGLSTRLQQIRQIVKLIVALELHLESNLHMILACGMNAILQKKLFSLKLSFFHLS
ncbi:hypothetical protein P4O66_001670 [Electrophorus voltai]|uniref:SPT3 homolog, SAGA and STAGA complex component n=1 Tax=Electrophorus voltai TaxID=2609070 RepID=A0AAD9DTT2_9TELE|nr:hypothetical protein P4O66_001670 [Electrophorus voltai]